MDYEYTPEQLAEMEEIENNARRYAAMVSEANDIVPVMLKECTVRIKSSNNAYYSLMDCLDYQSERSVMSLLGKTVKFTVEWGACGGVHHQNYMHIVLEDGTKLLFNKQDVKDIFTQKGDGPKMFDLWQLAKDSTQ